MELYRQTGKPGHYYTGKTYTKDFDLHRGDIVEFHQPGGCWGVGVVRSADFWTPETGWYIELDVDEGNVGYGYYQWKQGVEGGTVEKISP